MNESEFHDLVDQTLEAFQDAIDDLEADIDCEESGGVLTLEFDNGTKIIFSRQPPVHQIWVAARSGGFHFDYDDEKQNWVCDTGEREELYKMISRLASEQSGENITITA